MKNLIIFLFFLLPGLQVFATHNRAGEITYKVIGGTGGRGFEVTVTTYTKISANSAHADRPELTINWGDGTNTVAPRFNEPGELVAPDIKKNIYIATHTYSGPGKFRVSVEDPNRNAEIVNIAHPQGSDMIPFHIYSEITINPFAGSNNSPVLLFPPIDNGCVNRRFIHNAGAFDEENDVLRYRLVSSKGYQGEDIASYFVPPNVTIDSITGDLVWNTPTQMGEFNFAILIEEYRKVGTSLRKIGEVLRDMQVTIGNCMNFPPVINVTTDTCITAGEFLRMPVTFTDPDDHFVRYSATGGPFLLDTNAAVFPASITYIKVPHTDTLKWQTSCDQVQKPSYQIYFRAEDNGPEKLVDIKTLNVTVVAPAPENLQAVPLGNSINLSWNQSICPQAVRYDIYRKTGASGWTPGYCELGVPGYTGFTFLASVNSLTSTTYRDLGNLVHGNVYCYRVVAVYPDGAESYASTEACTELKKDVPIITNVTVLSTSSTSGIDSIAWSKPTELDMVQNPGPYTYRIMHAPGLNGTAFTQVGTTAGLDDTSFVHITNTAGNANTYRIDIWNEANGTSIPEAYLIGSSNKATSVFLTITPADNRLNLSWQFDVPWSNTSFEVYRRDGAGSFSLIATTAATSYTDTGLVNGQSYCYYIRSIGSYSTTGVVNPIINLSQEACATPVDVEPPCAPGLQVDADCNVPLNSISWSNPNNSCADDVVAYNLYYTPTEGGEFSLIKSFAAATDTFTTHVNEGPSIAGCYYVTAVDSFNNVSVPSNVVCVDNCPLYELPNVFTPDNEGKNDYFRPFPYKFVKEIDLVIFNRWGQPMFETKDPDIFWNGVNQESGKPCTEGVYFYHCVVYEIRLAGIVPRELKGSIHLFRSKEEIPTNK